MRIRWLFLAPCLLLGAASLHAATIYVDGRRPAESADGKSWATAYPQVQTALTAAQAGDEVWVAAGTYTVSAQLHSGVKLYGGFIGAETFRDQRPGLPGLTTLLGSSEVAPVLSLYRTGEGTLVDGFTLAAPVLSAWGVLDLSQSNATVSHNIITYRPAADAPPRPPRLSIPGGLVTCQGGAPVLVDNVVTASPTDGILCDGSRAEISNNTIAGNGMAGVNCINTAAPTLTNNIIAFNQAGVRADGASAPVLRNNCFHGNPGGNGTGMDDPIGHDGNIAADPRFASYELGNLHIQPDSPCVDAGWEDAASGELDIDLLPRVMGARVDIGADESDGRHWAVTPRIVRVSATGDDAGDGSSWQAAKATIQSAIDAAAVSGGEVWVAQGTYYGDASAQWWSTISLPSHVSLYGGFAGTETRREERDWGRYPTILTNSDFGNLLVATSGHRTSRVDGFLIMGNPLEVSPGGILASGASPVIANNVLTGFFPYKGGAALNMSGGFPLIYNNAIVANPGGSVGALTFSYAAPTLSHNIISGNATAGGSVITGTKGGACVAENNLIQGNSGSIFSGTWQSLSVVNNTLVGNNSAVIGQYGPGMIVANNIFTSNGSAFPKGNAPADSSIRNNDFYQSGDASAYVGKDGNIEAYPGFVDLRTGNYRLGAGSPCVDAGDDAVVEPGEVDLDGNPRIQGRHVDMGAYEFAGAASAPRAPDVLSAMKIAAGLQGASPDDMDWLNPDTQTPGISLTDAVLLLRQLKARADSME